MKNRVIRIGVLSMSFFMMLLVFPAGTRAETQDEGKKDLVSVLHLESTSLPGPQGISGKGKDRALNPLRTLLVPMKEGLSAFLDLSSPFHRGLTPKDSPTDYRATVGVRFRL